jgi:hypothetical protein
MIETQETLPLNLEERKPEPSDTWTWDLVIKGAGILVFSAFVATLVWGMFVK